MPRQADGVIANVGDARAEGRQKVPALDSRERAPVDHLLDAFASQEPAEQQA